MIKKIVLTAIIVCLLLVPLFCGLYTSAHNNFEPDNTYYNQDQVKNSEIEEYLQQSYEELSALGNLDEDYNSGNIVTSSEEVNLDIINEIIESIKEENEEEDVEAFFENYIDEKPDNEDPTDDNDNDAEGENEGESEGEHEENEIVIEDEIIDDIVVQDEVVIIFVTEEDDNDAGEWEIVVTTDFEDDSLVTQIPVTVNPPQSAEKIRLNVK